MNNTYLLAGAAVLGYFLLSNKASASEGGTYSIMPHYPSFGGGGGSVGGGTLENDIVTTDPATNGTPDSGAEAIPLPKDPVKNTYDPPPGPLKEEIYQSLEMNDPAPAYTQPAYNPYIDTQAIM